MRTICKWYICILIVVVLSIALAAALFFTHKKDDNESETTLNKPILTINNGQIMGRSKLTRKNVSYFSFTGIPYAEPPVGERRFEPPVPIKNWNGVIDATEEKSRCIQAFDIKEGTENCLHLNVYTPSLTKNNMTVMVYIYGGYFLEGDNSYDSFSPDYFMEEDVIIVTMNYRLGIFGFISTEDEVAPGNAGLKDQILALKWVQENIATFGGNPKLVTLFGQSAGSVSVSYLLQTEQTKGLFRATIQQSGTSLSEWALSRSKRHSLLSAAKSLNITSEDLKTIFEEFKKLNASQLNKATNIAEGTASIKNGLIHGLEFSPSLEPETVQNAVITGKSFEKLTNGKFHQLPSMIGLNTNEALIFEKISDAVKNFVLLVYNKPTRFIPVDMKPNSTDYKTIDNKIKKKYIKSIFGITTEELTRVLSDTMFDRSINKAAELHSKYAPVYHYLFSYNTKKDRKIPGVGHSEELDFLWANNEKNDDHPVTKRMVKLWTNFAIHLNPTPSKDEDLDNVNWEKFDTENRNYLEISEKLLPKKGYVNDNIQFWEDLYTNYGCKNYDTY